MVALEFAPSDPEGELIHTFRRMYDAIADWCQLPFTNDPVLRGKLRFSRAKHYEPLGDKALATKRLIEKVCHYARWKNFDSLDPLCWWVCVEAFLCEQLLDHSGYLGTALLWGKRKNHSESLSRYRALEKPVMKEVQLKDLDPLVAAEGIASIIGYHDGSWLYYESYKKEILDCDRILRDNSHGHPLYPIYLHQGKLKRFTRGRGSGIRRQKKD